MKFLITLLVVLVASVSSALVLLRDPGYVLLSYSGVSIETTLPVFALALLAAFLLLAAIIRLLRLTLYFPDSMFMRGQKHRRQRAKENFYKGLKASAEGQWKQAEKYLVRAAENNEAPLLGYLEAARVAQHQRRTSQRDQYLQMAHKTGKGADTAAGLTQAALLLEQGQLEQAMALLNRLTEKGPKNQLMMEMQLDLYQKLDEWEKLKEHLPEFWKMGVVSDENAARLEIEVTIRLIQKIAMQGDISELLSAWQDLPRDLKSVESIVLEYINQLTGLNAHGEAEKILFEVLEHQWSTRLFKCYGQVKGRDPVQQLKNAEAWSKGYLDDAEVQLALGRLCIRCDLKENAADHLRKSIDIAPRAEACVELGRLSEQMDEAGSALSHYRDALDIEFGKPDSIS